MTQAWYEIPQCKGLPEVARWIEERVADWPGVTEARCRPSTGRLHIVWSDGAARELGHVRNLDELLERAALHEIYRKNDAADRSPRKRKERLDWRSLTTEQLRKSLHANLHQGLSAHSAEARRREHGPNIIPPIPPRSNAELLARQFQNPSTQLLLTSAALSLLTGGTLEAGVIAGIVLVNSGIGFTTEQRAERRLESLAEFGPRHAWVIRAGKKLEVPLPQIVPGDLLLLEPGFSIVADARLIEARELLVDESILTGESVPLAKTAKRTVSKDRPLAESFNMVFKGSVVVAGHGKALVVETGKRTEAGRIQELLGDRYHASTLLQEKLEALNRGMVTTGLAASAGLLATGFVRGQPMLELVKTAISMAVAAVPEGLPMISSATMSRAVSELLRSHVLVRDLQSIETLGSLDTICLDKTGTLTLNQMRVEALALPHAKAPLATSDGFSSRTLSKPDRARLKSLLACAVLCNDAARKEDRGSGSPTESALLEFARANGIRSRRLRRSHPRLRSRYRTEGQPYMVTSHRDPRGRVLTMMKGSPAEVLALCRSMRTPRGTLRLDTRARESILAQNRQLSDDALRVLGFAYQITSPRKGQKAGWIWLGLIGLKDPPRPGMRHVIEEFDHAGIRTVMITGDQAPTAAAIARQLGMLDGRPGPSAALDTSLIVDFAEFKRGKPTPAMLQKLAARARVFARVAPEDKREIIEALRASGRVVAMVGDGINDAPALKAAQLGIAIGQRGAEAAKEVAGLVLLDDRLDRLLSSIALGRAASGALRKTVRFLTSTNLAEMAVMLLESALGLPETMDAMHLIWVNLVNDTFPALALALDRSLENALAPRSKEPKDHALINRNELVKIGRDIAVLSTAVFASLAWGHGKNRSREQNQTLVLNTMSLGQTLFALGISAPDWTSWRELAKKHRPLLTASLASLAAQVAVTRLPGLKRTFKLSSLSPADHAMSLVLAVAGVAVSQWRRSSNAPVMA